MAGTKGSWIVAVSVVLAQAALSMPHRNPCWSSISMTVLECRHANWPLPRPWSNGRSWRRVSRSSGPKAARNEIFTASCMIRSPAQLALTRHLQHEADRFALEITQTNHSAGTAFVKLQEDALGNPWPGPLFKLWRAHHPPLGERIEFSNDYHPWLEGAPLRYGPRFRN